ncbi:MAG: hypothetical protein ABIV50_10390 [Opitutus sp.]
MKTKALFSVVLILIFGIHAYADWQKFDDFEGGNLKKWIFTQSNVGTVADSSVSIVIDPDVQGAAAGNHVMVMNPGHPYASDHRSRLIGRPAPINYGTTGTAFYRWYTKTVNIGGTEFPPSIDMNVGMSAVDIPTQYNESGPVTGYDVGADQFRAYNGDPNPANPASVIGFQNIVTNRPNNVWVSQWFYIRNLSVSKAQQDYQVYTRVGNSGTPVLVFPFVAGEFGGFRAKPDGDLDPASAHLDVFYFTNTAGNIAAPQAADAAFYADDVYIDQDGLNLSDPTGGGGGGGGGAGSGLVNMATRGEVQAGDKALIAGFVISGGLPQKVLVRAAGPALSKYGVNGTLAAPVLTLQSQIGVKIGTNSGWDKADNAADVATAASTVGAFAFPTGSKDAALLVTLPPGVYTTLVTGGTGIALVEVYSVAQ